MSNKLWVNGICDNILTNLQYWVRHYEEGKITATRRYLTKPGELGPAPQEINKPTRKALAMPWRKVELDMLVATLDKVIPHEHPTYALVRDLRKNITKWSHIPCGMWQGKPLTLGAKVIEIDWYFNHIVQVYRIFEALKYDLPLDPPKDLASVDLENIDG